MKNDNTKLKIIRKREGVTILELMISIAVLAILMAISIRALNPSGQFAASRNSQRNLHVLAILNSIRSNIADTRTGIFTCAAGDIPTTTKKMASGSGNYNIASCLIPNYMNVLPIDPSASSSYFNSVTDYNSGYNVVRNVSGTVSVSITVSAPNAELGKTISVTR
mgnify:CR=1 FL=1